MKSNCLNRLSFIVSISSLLLATTAQVAKAAIFTIEYSGSVTEASSSSPSATQIGDRILGRYTFDDTNSEVILGRFLLLPADSTERLDPVEIASAENVFRQNVPSLPPNPSNEILNRYYGDTLVRRTSVANQNSAQYSKIGIPGGSPRAGSALREVFVNPQSFTYDYNFTSGAFSSFTKVKGSIDSFAQVGNVTTTLPTEPTIPTDSVEPTPTPTPTPTPPPVNPIGVPEPSTDLSLIAFAGIGLVMLRRKLHRSTSSSVVKG